MKGRLFISYRRAADVWAVGHLRERLFDEFGAEHVFFDTETLPSGERWLERIQNEIRRARALVVVFGEHWYGHRPDGTRRIDDTDDPVRMELLEARNAGVTLVPVMVDESPQPRAQDLPEDLRFLLEHHFRRLRATDSLARQTDRLILDLRQVVYGTPLWRHYLQQALWVAAVAAAVALSLRATGLTGAFHDGFARSVQGLRGSLAMGAPEGLAVVEVSDDEYRELFGGRVPLDPQVMSVVVTAIERRSRAAGSCAADRPVGINIDLAPGEALADDPQVAALEQALRRLAACRPLVLACPQSVERGQALAIDRDWMRRLRMDTPTLRFASTFIDPTLLRPMAGRWELGMVVGDLASGRAPMRGSDFAECACPADAETMARCHAQVAALQPLRAADRSAVVAPFSTRDTGYSLSRGLLKGHELAGAQMLLLGGGFGTQGRFAVAALPEAQDGGVSGTVVHTYLAELARGQRFGPPPAWLQLLADFCVAAGVSAGLMLGWRAIAERAVRFSARATGYLGIALLSAGVPLACLALATHSPALTLFAGNAALVALLTGARSAMSGFEVLLNGGVGWKSIPALAQALRTETSDRAGARLRLVMAVAEALMIAAACAAALWWLAL